MFKKLGENFDFSSSSLLEPKQALQDTEIAARFVKMAKKLRRIAPKAKDFVYGDAIIMHSAEASLIDLNTGKPILNKNGEPVQGCFEDFINKKGVKSVRWISKDGIKPYKNKNGDIFSEAELLKAYKKWIGKPLCKDHISDSVDGIRGIIIDTYYDSKFKRVRALFALDRKNYGDLARKVESGYATAVSMGTAVGRAVCTECGNVAVTEKEYCNCIRSHANYGEINLDLSPLELSLVVNGADGLAHVRNVIASMNNYVETKQARICELVNDRCVNPTELQSIADSLSDMQTKISGLLGLTKKADLGEDVAALREISKMEESLNDPEKSEETKEKLKKRIHDLEIQLDRAGEEQKQEKTWPPVRPGPVPSLPSSMDGDASDLGKPSTTTFNGFAEPNLRYASLEGDKQGALSVELGLLRSKIDKMQDSLNVLNTKVSKEENIMNSARLRARAKARRAYWLGGGGINEPTPGQPKYEKDPMAEKVRDSEDKQMVGEPLETGSEGLHPGDEEKLRDAGRNGLNLSKAELKERALKRRGYFQGGGGINEPTPGQPKYEKDPMAENVRDKEDKQLETYDMGGTDGTVPGDMEIKKTLLRAKLRAKFVKVADRTGGINKAASRWEVYAGDKMILTATGKEIFDDQLEGSWDYLSSRDYGKDVIAAIRSDGFDRVAYLLKGAADPMPADPLAGDPLAGLPAAAPAPDAAPPAAEAPAEPKKEEGGVKEKVDSALGEMEEAIESVRSAVTEGGEKLVDIEVKVDEDAKGEGKDSTPVAALTAAERSELMELHALLNESADELALISEALESNKSDRRVVNAAYQALSDAQIILEAKKKKVKDDEEEDKEDGKGFFGKKDKKDEDKDDKKDKKDEDKDDKKEDKDEKKDKKDAKKDKKDEDKEDEKESKAQKLLNDALRVRSENRAALLSKMAEPELKDMVKEKVNTEIKKELEGGLPADDAMLDDSGCLGCTDDVVESDESAKLARRKAREELVANAAKSLLGKYELDLGPASNATEPTYFQAHPSGKGTVTELTHTKTPEAKVETISEVHDVMRDVAESGPRNVREAAALLQEAIVKGAFSSADVDGLVAEGKVDAAAAAYWKKYFAMAPDSNNFGAELSKEFATKKKASEDTNYKVKLRRAYDIGLMAQEKGMIGETRASLDTYVDEVMQFDDAAFESTKRIVAGMSGRSKKSSLPRVGADAANEAMNVTASSDVAPVVSLTDQLGSLGWK